MSNGFSVRTIAGPGLWSALRNVREEARIMAVHWKSARKATRLSSTGMYLNCGCGPNIKRGWVNIDLFNSEADYHLDLRCPLPFGDGTAAIVYSEHFFEHLEYPNETSTFLSGSFRVLERGGLFRVGVPDAEWPITAYASGDERYFKFAKECWHPRWCDTRMHNINYHFRQGNQHKYAYDYETLQKVLVQAGFSAVSRSEFNSAFDSESRRVGTLYVEGRR